MSPRRGAGRGQALAEFALAIPLVLLLIVAVFDVGRAVFAYNAITNAAREGARLAIVNQDVTSVQARAVGQAGGTTTTADVAVAFIESSSGDTCDGAGGNPALAIGCSAQVTVTTRWQAITPLIGSVLGPMTFTAVASLPVEFVCGVATADITNPAGCPKQP
ncbi:MAG: TadE family protein [Candidatus Limnocylindrales bacterium]